MDSKGYSCSKCGNSTYETGEIRATGGFWTKIFNIQNRKFTTVSCTSCGYTDLYNRSDNNTLENIIDFLGN